jgi:siroheme synthase
LQVRATQILRLADVVVFDDLGAQAAVETYAPAAAQRVFVGKRGGRPSIKQPEIDSIIVQHASAGSTVVRLKGGCPSVFSRVGDLVCARFVPILSLALRSTAQSALLHLLL